MTYIDIVFEGGPDHDGGRFVEVENERGESVRVGEWIEPWRYPEKGAFWRLRIPQPPGWRPLTEDPATWPEEGQDVAILWRDRRTSTGTWRAICGANSFEQLVTHWAPLPPLRAARGGQVTSPDLPAPAALARDVLGETLHGPVPMRTVARLAEAVLAQHDECSRLQAEVTQLRAERDMPCAHRLEEERLQERVRVLEEAMRGIRACALDQLRMHEVNRDGIECTGRLDAIEHYVWAALEGIEVE